MQFVITQGDKEHRVQLAGGGDSVAEIIFILEAHFSAKEVSIIEYAV
jgi:hypothetical protein